MPGDSRLEGRPMSLKLYLHPLSSYCHKVLIALYENGTPFEPVILADLGDPAAASTMELKRLWPLGKFPVLQDLDAGQVTAESSIIIEYLDQHYPGAARMIPADPDAALNIRFMDRFFDQYVMQPQGRLVFEMLRPEGSKDPFGVADARRTLETAYGFLEETLSDGRTWAAGDAFSMADCVASPALFYAQRCQSWGDRPRLQAYYDRLEARPAFARVLEEAQPYMHMFPGGPAY
jgi:glutathione S-transferase